jgi:hypothetical protein
MAYWGLAMSYYHPLWSPPDTAALRKGWEGRPEGREVGSSSQREKDYIAAIEVFYRDWDKVDHRTRSLAYSKAMEQLRQLYPDRQGSGGLLRPFADFHRAADRQDVRQPEEGGGNSGADPGRNARSSRRDSLHHPRV